MAQDERSFRVLVDIGDLGVINLQSVDFKGVDVFHGLLPAALFERDLAGGFSAQLQQVDIDFRPIEP